MSYLLGHGLCVVFICELHLESSSSTAASWLYLSGQSGEERI